MPLELEDQAAFPVMSFSRAFQFADAASTAAAYTAVKVALSKARQERKTTSVRSLRWEMTTADLIARGASQKVVSQWIDLCPGDEIRIVRRQEGSDLWVLEFHRCVSCALTPGSPMPIEVYGMVGLFGLIGPLPPWQDGFEETMAYSLAQGQFANVPGALSPRVVDGETVAR